MDLNVLKEELISGTAQLFDVRETHEWNAGHLKVAKFVPLSNLENNIIPEGLNKNVKTYLHCRSGVRVHRAAPILLENGFREVIPLPHGFEELALNGFDKV